MAEHTSPIETCEVCNAVPTDELQAKLKARAAPRYVKADPAPVYDKVFEDGVTALNRDAGDDLAEIEGEVHFSDEVLYHPFSSPQGNPKAAQGALKVPLHLVPPALVICASRAMAEGAAKYGPYNWREPGRGIKASTYHGAIMRHLLAMMDGEDVDPDSPNGKLHLDGLAANVAILCDAHEGGFLTDDRPLPGPAPRLILVKKGA